MGMVGIFLQRRGSGGGFGEWLDEISGSGSEREPGLPAVVLGSDAGTKRGGWPAVAGRFYGSLLSARGRIQHQCQQFDATDAESFDALALGYELYGRELDC